MPFKQIIGTVIVGVVLAGIIALVIIKMVKDKKNNKGCCNGSCGNCHACK